MRKWLVAFVALGALAGGSAQASNTAPVIVMSITPTNYGMVYFTHAGTRTQIPSCGAASNSRYAFSVATPGGQAMLSTLLTAFATHKPVTIVGTSACDQAAPDTESAAYFVISD